MECPRKGEEKKKEAQGTSGSIGFTTNQTTEGYPMERTHDSTSMVGRHTHFTYEERLRLAYYLQGKGRYPKVESPSVLGWGRKTCCTKDVVGSLRLPCTGIAGPWEQRGRSRCAPRRPRTYVFYVHPYTASERGTNENHNGIVRRSVPKGAALKAHPSAGVRRLQHWMNGYPRRILGGRTPFMFLRKDFPLFPRILEFFNPRPKEVS